MGLSAADAPAGGGACKNSVTRVATRPAVAGKTLLFHFFSLATVTTFFCRLNLHCFCVFWSPTTFLGPWELYMLIPTDFSSL